MKSYQHIMNLVEEVRGILDLHEQGEEKPQKKGKLHHKTKAKLIAKFGSKTPHNPFKNLKKGKHLGGTSKAVAKIKGPSTTTPGTRRGFWRCRCHGYACHCIGKTAEGKQVEKTVHIDRGYKKIYNKNYRTWRKKHAKLFAPGGKRGFRAPAKKHHARYHAD